MDTKEIILRLVRRLMSTAEFRTSCICADCGINTQLYNWVVNDEGMTSTDWLCAECATTHIMDGRVTL